MFKNSNMVAEDKQCYKKVKVFIVQKIYPIVQKIIDYLTNGTLFFFIVLFSILTYCFGSHTPTNFSFYVSIVLS